MELVDALRIVRAHHRGVLVTYRTNGRAQLSNVAYYVDAGDVICVSVTDDRAKTKNLRRNERCDFYVGREDFWAYLVVEATCALTPPAAALNDTTVDALVDYYRAVQGEHPDWDEYRAAMLAERRLVARLTPRRAYGTWSDAS